jgi:hypothetical protein
VLQSLIQSFKALPTAIKVVVALLVLGLMVVASPFTIVLAVLSFFVSVFVLLIQVVRQRPWTGWGLVVAASILSVFLFTDISNALYGGSVQQGNAAVQPATTLEKPDMEAEPARTGDTSPSNTQAEGITEQTTQVQDPTQEAEYSATSASAYPSSDQTFDGV